MRKSLLAVVVVTGVGLLMAGPASAATVFSTSFDAGYTPGSLWGQPSGSGQVWGSSNYSSTPGGTGDSWLSDAKIVADPTDSSNQVAQFYGDCSGGAVHGAAAGIDVAANGTDDITFTQSAYFDPAMTAGHSLCMSVLCANGGCQWGGNQNFCYGNYGYFVKRYDQPTLDKIAAGMVTWSLWNTSTGNYESLFVPKGSWSTASVTFHIASQTADLTVTDSSGTQQLLGIPSTYIAGSVIGGQTRYDMYTDGDGDVVGNILLDNVSITQVPEPATLCLLALGGLAALRRRHA